MNHTFSPRFSTDAAKSPELNVIISTSSPYISAWVGGLGYLNVIAVYIYMGWRFGLSQRHPRLYMHGVEVWVISTSSPYISTCLHGLVVWDIAMSSPYISTWGGGLGYLNVISVYIYKGWWFGLSQRHLRIYLQGLVVWVISTSSPYISTWGGGLGYLNVIPMVLVKYYGIAQFVIFRNFPHNLAISAHIRIF